MEAKIERVKKELKEIESWTSIFSQKSFWKELSTLLIFPIVVTLIYLIFSSKRAWFSFDMNSPRWWTFFTSSFMHGSWSHLLGNMQAYIALTILLCILYYKMNLTKYLNKAYLILILTTPIISNAINYFLLVVINKFKLPPSTGSSDIVSGIIGLSFYSLLILMDLKNKFDKSVSFALFFTPLVIIMFFKLSAIPAIIVLFTPIYVWVLFKSFKRKKILINLVYFILLFATIAVFTLNLFPTNIVSNGSITNIMAHLMGLLYGLFIGRQFILRPLHKKHWI